VKRFVTASVAAALAASLACGSVARRQPRGRVRVAAASDLNAALPDLVARFSQSRGVDVVVSYGSSGTFYAQLLNQAPFDLFFSADLEYPRQLAKRGLTLEGAEFQYAVGRLVLWVPRSSSIDVSRIGLKGLASAPIAHLSIANPAHAPYGRAAVAALQSAGVYEALRARLVFGENVAQAMQFVQSGAADAGLVALSLALAPPARDTGRYVEIPLDAYPRIDQGGTILKWAADIDAARALRAYVLSAEGHAVLRQYGFSLPND
jgi:molybdate transport system substrate-binding protein